MNKIALYYIAEVFNVGKISSAPSMNLDFWLFSITNFKQNLMIINITHSYSGLFIVFAPKERLVEHLL
jgi:hypothetical protein